MRQLLHALLLCAVIGCDNTPRDQFSRLQPEYDAAVKGDADSQFKMGDKCFLEDGVASLKWFHKAAEQGHAPAMGAIGSFYDSSLTVEDVDWETFYGVAKDDAEARKWYRKAALAGDFGSALNLNNRYMYGIGVDADYGEAYVWLSVAAAIGKTMRSNADTFVQGQMKNIQTKLDQCIDYVPAKKKAATQQRADELIAQITIGSMKMASVAVEPQDTSRKEDDVPEAVTAKAGDTENTRRWYDLFVVNQDNQKALKSGTIKGGKTVTIELEAEKKRHIGFGTNVFQDDISFADGETIAFHQTKGAVAGIGMTSTDGNGGGQEFTPVDGVLSFQLENNSKHTLKYVIYEVVENKEAVPHPTSTNATASQSQTQDSVPAVNSIGMRFVPISAGTFTRGQGESAHKVTLMQPFHLGQYEVTQEQYKQVMGKNPSGFKDAAHPVETVNWNEAVEFCRKLSAMPQEKSAGFVYRLPTDAEWEYASRAGTTTGFSFGDASAEMGNYGWLTSNSQETTHPVGQKKPNPWGLYDMYGNVWEWCLDWDGRRSSGSSVPVTDPTGPTSGSLRVFRGGGWKSSSRNCRPDNRGKLAEVYRGNTLGLRVVRTLARPVSQPGKPTKAVVPAANSIGMRFVPIPAGTFTMGSPEDESGRADTDETLHNVTLTQPFEFGVYEVTQEHYQRVMGLNRSAFKGPQNPVEGVHWNDAVEFCQKLSDLSAEKNAGYVYRLPTEAEWEYACRAGTTTGYSFGDSGSKLSDYAWYNRNVEGTTHPVGGKKPNAWGLYDMHGNVCEWCQDWYGDYPSGSVTDPTGAARGSYRVYRGSSWGFSAGECRSADRSRGSPGNRSYYLGFRVVRTSIK